MFLFFKIKYCIIRTNVLGVCEMKYRIGCRFKMIYLAKTGEITTRYVKVLSETDQYLKVFCYRKRNYRTLNKTRILSAEKTSNERTLVS